MLGVQIFPVHRLDFVVSGLVLFAKTAEAHRVANGWFEQHRVQKTYRAWTQQQSFAHIPADVPNPRRAIALHEGDRFDWHGRIQRGKRRAFESPRGQPSHTIAVYLGPHPHNRFLQWDLQAVTGRPHQLRFDLSRHGFPIVGDALYGSNVEFGVDRIALLAYRLDFSAITEGDRFGLPERIEIAPEF
jgi:tRNA pseudouridine32 synthase/23S rRNA pseudouridine746 synthase